MILLSLGTHEQPFGRALEMVVPLGSEEPVLVQHGSTPPIPDAGDVEWVEFLEVHELRRQMASSSVTIVHGGVGSIIDALKAGRIPVVLPRLARYQEHVDDHQVEIVRSLAALGLAIPCLPEDDVHAVVRLARASAGRSIGVGRRLEQALADEALAASRIRERSRPRRRASRKFVWRR